MQPEILYRLAVEADKDAVLQFFREHFYPDETLCGAYEPNEQLTWHENVLINCVSKPNQYCLLATNGDQIVGARVFESKTPNEEQLLLEEASHVPGTKSEKFLWILSKIERESNVFQRYNVTRVMHGIGLVVHKDFRGHRIGLKLFEKSIEMAKILEYELFSCDCTSIYSARQAELLGMECVNVCKIEDYRAPDSKEQIFFPAEHQKYIKTYAKKFCK